MLQEVGAWLNLENPTADAVAAVERACANLLTGFEGPTGMAAVEQPAGATAGRHVSRGRRAARSSLSQWGGGEHLTGAAPAALDKREAQLARLARLYAGFNRRDAHQLRRAHREHFPALFLVAASGLGAAGSSAACERYFSVAGCVVRAERFTFSSASVELQSFVSANADLVPSEATAVRVLTHADAALFRARMNTFVPDTFVDVVDEGSGSGWDESEAVNDERGWGISC